MAESLVQVTEGSGKKLHTYSRVIGANTVEDEVVIPGLPHLATYRVALTAGISVATGNDHLLQIMAGPSLAVYVRRIWMWQVVAAGALTAGAVALYRLASAGTGGTAMQCWPLDSADPMAGATAMSRPTAKGAEGPLLSYRAAIYWAALPVSGGQSPLIAAWDFGGDLAKMLRIPPGTANGIAVKNPTGPAGASVFIEAEIIESPV